MGSKVVNGLAKMDVAGGDGSDELNGALLQEACFVLCPAPSGCNVVQPVTSNSHHSAYLSMPRTKSAPARRPHALSDIFSKLCSEPLAL